MTTKPEKRTKPRRYVTRWLLAYEWRIWEIPWSQSVDSYATRGEACKVAKDYASIRTNYRNIMPPQAVKVMVR